MIAALVNHLWQSTLFALGAGLLTLMVRRNGAAVRHALWLAASVKFLIPFALLAATARMVTPRLHLALAPPQALTALAPVVQPIAEVRTPVTPAFGALPAAPPLTAPTAPVDLAPLLIGLWALGLAAVLLIWAVRWSRIRAALRAAHPVKLPSPAPVLSTPAPLEPGVIGILRPVILVPEGIAERLSPAEWQAVLAHELCHIRRRDNLTGLIHMLVQALFWFHPLVWWLGARLVVEREQACDEAVASAGVDGETYAEGILKVCRLYVQQPLACAAGVSGADLKARVERILAGRIGARLGLPKRVMLAAAALLSIAAPVSAGLLAAAPSVRAEVADIISSVPLPLPEAPAAPAATRPVAVKSTPAIPPSAPPHAARPVVLASIEAVSSSAPEVPALRATPVATDLSQTLSPPAVFVAQEQALPPSKENKMPRLFPAVLTSVIFATGAAAQPTVYIPPGAAQPRFGGEFALTQPGPVAGYWRSECYRWHVRSQARRTGPAAEPPVDAAFKRFVSGLIDKKPDYEDMSPAMAESVRKNLAATWPSYNHMGHASVARKFDTTKDGDALYVLDLTGGVTHWNLTIDRDGKIASAFFCAGTGL